MTSLLISLTIAAAGVITLLLVFRVIRGRFPWEPFPETAELLELIREEEEHAAQLEAQVTALSRTPKEPRP